MVSCFARGSPKITGLMWTIWTSLSAVPRKAVIFNHSLTRPRYSQFSWCSRYLVLSYLNNTTFMHQRFKKLTDFGVDMNKFCQKKLMLGICCSSEWNLCWKFGKSQGTIFCELCGNPVITSIIMCGMK